MNKTAKRALKSVAGLMFGIGREDLTSFSLAQAKYSASQPTNELSLQKWCHLRGSKQAFQCFNSFCPEPLL